MAERNEPRPPVPPQDYPADKARGGEIILRTRTQRRDLHRGACWCGRSCGRVDDRGLARPLGLACTRTRLRSILMTSLAFIFGVGQQNPCTHILYAQRCCV